MATFEDLQKQINCLTVIVRSIGIKRALHHVEDNPHLNFWRFMYGSMLDVAVIEWCKVFGTDDQPTHWKKFIKDELLFKQGLFSYLKVDEAAWVKYWSDMKTYRNHHAAHHLGLASADDVYPVLDMALKSSFYYYSYLIKEVRALGYSCYPDKLENYSEHFYEQTVMVAKAALDATKAFEEKVF